MTARLPDIPFHGKDLLHGNEEYATMSPGDREQLLTQFTRFVRELSISFFVLYYDAASVHNRTELEARIRYDLASLVFERLSFSQNYDEICVYYDNGQGAVSAALHDALDFVFAKMSLVIETPSRTLADCFRSPTMPVRWLASPESITQEDGLKHISVSWQPQEFHAIIYEAA